MTQETWQPLLVAHSLDLFITRGASLGVIDVGPR